MLESSHSSFGWISPSPQVKIQALGLKRQCHPYSFKHVEEHPSPSSKLLSSHSSYEFTIPSPHASIQMEGFPEQMKPDSSWQSLSHPSKSSLFPSSHVSKVDSTKEFPHLLH